MRALRQRTAGVLLASMLVACGGGAANDARPRPRTQADTSALQKQLAFSLAAHREWAAATRPLLQLRAQDPNDPEVHTMLGNVYREQGLFEQSEAAYLAAIRLAPKSAPAYAGLGILREVRGDRTDLAIEDFRTAVRLMPEEAGYHNNLGFAFYVRGRYAEAESALQAGLRYDPLSRRMRNNLGFIYGRMGQLSRAKREFQHGGREDEVENNIGYVNEQATDYVAACTHYREALAKNPLLTVASENAHRVCHDGVSIQTPRAEDPVSPEREPGPSSIEKSPGRSP